MKVICNGHRVPPKKAKGSKVGIFPVSAGHTWGRRTASATGIIPTRKGTARVAVGPRLPDKSNAR